jgi:hypothetical protein
MKQEEFQTRVEQRKLEHEQGIMQRFLPEKLTKQEYESLNSDIYKQLMEQKE